jgi:hypothetical protein
MAPRPIRPGGTKAKKDGAKRRVAIIGVFGSHLEPHGHYSYGNYWGFWKPSGEEQRRKAQSEKDKAQGSGWTTVPPKANDWAKQGWVDYRAAPIGPREEVGGPPLSGPYFFGDGMQVDIHSEGAGTEPDDPVPDVAHYRGAISTLNSSLSEFHKRVLAGDPGGFFQTQIDSFKSQVEEHEESIREIYRAKRDDEPLPVQVSAKQAILGTIRDKIYNSGWKAAEFYKASDTAQNKGVEQDSHTRTLQEQYDKIYKELEQVQSNIHGGKGADPTPPQGSDPLPEWKAMSWFDQREAMLLLEAERNKTPSAAPDRQEGRFVAPAAKSAATPPGATGEFQHGGFEGASDGTSRGSQDEAPLENPTPKDEDEGYVGFVSKRTDLIDKIKGTKFRLEAAKKAGKSQVCKQQVGDIISELGVLEASLAELQSQNSARVNPYGK